MGAVAMAPSDMEPTPELLLVLVMSLPDLSFLLGM
jgi:hypothetical protein